jgi:hypothetical protein
MVKREKKIRSGELHRKPWKRDGLCTASIEFKRRENKP